MTERTGRHRFALALGGIGAAALVIRLAFVRIVDPKVPALGDATAYHLLAMQLAKGDGYIRPYDAQLLHLVRPTAEYPPLFPALLAVAYRFGAHSVTAQREFVAFVGVVTVVLIGLLGRRVGGPAVGLVAAALAACYPMLFQPEGTLMAEALYAPLVVVVLLLAYRAHDRATVVNFALLGVAAGFATLARAEGLLLGVVTAIGLGIVLHDRSAARRVGLVAVAVGASLIVIAPWTVRNAVRLHAFVPVSTNVSTLVDGANCDATYHGTLLGLWRETFGAGGTVDRSLPQAQACFEGFAIQSPNFNEASEASTHLHDGLAYAAHHPAQQPKVMAVRVLRTWALYAPNQQVNFETLEGRPKTWQWLGTIMFWVMLPFAIAGVVIARRRHTFVWPLIATAITVTIVAALTYGQQRFRIAAEPAVIVLAALALCELARSFRRRAPVAL
jgi:4-amino-4-deoxy-L-arabinose transferase-like glycosyltransferase